MTLERIPDSTNWRGPCPHCGQAAFLPSAYHLENQVGTHDLLICPNCLRSTVAMSKGSWTATFPSGTPPVVDPRLPDHIRTDYEQASKCHTAGLHTAAAIMCRRLVELSTQEKGAEGNNLYQKIESLVQSGALPAEVGKVAHAIRIIGNDGAHPDYPDLVDLTQTDAEKALDFVRLYTEYVYVLPAKTSQLGLS